MMAWIEAETIKHCKFLVVLLHERVFNKYKDWLAQGECVKY